MHYVYVLENLKGKHYIGSCENTEERLKQHNRNSVRSTKNKGPYRIIYKRDFLTKTEARKWENKLKSFKGGQTFKKLIGDFKAPIV